MSRMLDQLREVAQTKSASLPDEDFVVRGLWRIDYRYRPNQWERDLAYSMLLAQTTRQGCCYVDYATGAIDESFLGTDGRTVEPDNPSTAIAILDAVYGIFDKTPESTLQFNGSSSEKAERRAQIVTDEVFRELADMGGNRVLNVGVMGIFLRQLGEKGVQVIGSDFAPDVANSRFNETDIYHGERTMELIPQCDVVLATGMTLTTDSLGDILREVQSHGKRLILFAATGANFAQEYCDLFGVDVVLSEVQPQYMFQGTSTISVYRKKR